MTAALITGGAKRIGRSIALTLASNGVDVALHYNTSKREAEQVKAEIEALGRRCVLLQANLQDVAALPALVASAKQAFPHVNILINNASVFERCDFLHTDEALFERQFATNFKAPFFLSQAFAKAVDKGQIINMLDTDITKTHGSHFAYLLSKKALADFTHMAARALGPKFRVNGVALGIALPSNELDEGYMKRLAAALPLEENTSPQAAADAVLALLNMHQTTGQIIYVDGGQHLL